MEDAVFTGIPAPYMAIEEATGKLDFNMNSDLYTGSLLKTLVASKKAEGYWNSEQVAVWQHPGSLKEWTKRPG